MMRVQRINSRSRRAGFVVVVVLVCLTVVTLLLASVLQSSMAWRRQVRKEATHTQVAWLAESGMARALMKMESDEEYTGEVWKPKEPLVAGNEANVEIVVRGDNGARVDVTATLIGASKSTAKRSLVIEEEQEE